MIFKEQTDPQRSKTRAVEQQIARDSWLFVDVKVSKSEISASQTRRSYEFNKSYRYFKQHTRSQDTLSHIY